MLRKAVGLEPLAGQKKGLHVQVACGGCAGGDQMLQAVYDALTRLGISGEVERVSDTLEIAALGLRGTPALVVNGEVKVVGSIPPGGQIDDWLHQAAEDAV
ncbi:MAG: thioredoxin family protein [Deltaproteobacteria bacterium]|nr:thioredoxin family protein [Deltaproteobacteria bacterium]